MSGPARFDLLKPGVYQESAIVHHVRPHHLGSENHPSNEPTGDELWRLEIDDKAHLPSDFSTRYISPKADGFRSSGRW